jgi:hypothetical protein
MPSGPGALFLGNCFIIDSTFSQLSMFYGVIAWADLSEI